MGNTFNGWINPHPTNVEELKDWFFKHLYNNATRVFDIENCPDTVDYDFLKAQLILNGSTAFVDRKGLKALPLHLSGKPNEFYRPTRVIGANPVLGTFDLENEKQAAMVYLTPSDRINYLLPQRTGGIYELINYISWLLADNICSINTAQINSRVHAIYTADDKSLAASGKAVLKEIYDGKPFSVITKEMLNNFNITPISGAVSNNIIPQLVEVHQFFMAMFWNALGVDYNNNMKRERLITAEVEKNLTAVSVPVNVIIKTLQVGLDQANAIFGTSMKAVSNLEIKEEGIKEEPESEESEGDKDGDPENDTEGSRPAEGVE